MSALKNALRADQVGSFLRPSAILEARALRKSGNLNTERLRELEDAAILELLTMQADVGMPIFSDGEIRREAWQTGFSEAVDGFVASPRIMTWINAKGERIEEPSYSKVVGEKLRSRRRFTEIESRFLRRHAPGPYKLTIPSPVLIARMSFKPGVTDTVYPRPDELLEDVLGIMRHEVRALIAEGVPYLQFDEGFTGFVVDAWRDQARAQGHDPAQVLGRAVAGENALYDSVDRGDAILAIHICRGNSRSRWSASGGYDAMAEQVFGGLHVDRFLLEYDSDRAGDFSPLRHLPKGKIAVLGLISTKTGELEQEADLLRRIDEAQHYLPIDQLAISPQCGFASVKEGNELSFDQQRRKLALTVAIADKVWGAPA